MSKYSSRAENPNVPGPFHVATPEDWRTPLLRQLTGFVSYDLRFEFAGMDSNFSGMNLSQNRVRRATLDDVEGLKALWSTMGFPVEELGRRITEFQVVEGANNSLMGAVGLQIAERQGLIHNEAFVDFALADQLRPSLWERIQAVATNHGLIRLWTREQAPFWNHCGLLKADAETEAKLPDLWKGQAQGWLTLKLREDVETLVSADKEFALFMEAEKKKTARAFQQARVLKTIVILFALALFVTLLGAAFLMARKNPHLLGR